MGLKDTTEHRKYLVLNKIGGGLNETYTVVLLRQLQTSDHRFHAMSAFTSASTSPKNGWKYQKTMTICLIRLTLVMMTDEYFRALNVLKYEKLFKLN